MKAVILTFRASDARSEFTAAGIPQSATPSISAGRVTILNISSSVIPSKGSIATGAASFRSMLVGVGERGREGPADDASVMALRVLGEEVLDDRDCSPSSSRITALLLPSDLLLLTIVVADIEGTGDISTVYYHRSGLDSPA